jgi:predicted acylesterase/phospholipase RssA
MFSFPDTTDTSPFEALVLSGGGAKGVGELGPLMYYEEKGLLRRMRIKVYSGTSVGSMINLLTFCGYTPLEILEEGCTFGDIFDFSRMSSIVDIFTKTFGLWSIKPLMEKIEVMVEQRLGKIPTLLEIYSVYGVDFIVAATNNSKRKGEYFSYRTRPHLLVTDAVKISCSLPLIFHRLRFKGDYYSDGGSFDNCPIFPVDTSKLKTLCISVGGTDYYGQNSLPELFSEIIPYLYSIVTTPIVLATSRSLANLGPNVTLVTINYEQTPVLAMGTDSNLKKEMFIQSYREAKRLDSIQKLYLRGWEWDVETSDSGTDFPPGWEWEVKWGE